MKALFKESIDKSISYNAYKDMFETLVNEGKSSGSNQTEDLSHFTKMNLSRAKRVEKKLTPESELLEKINAIDTPMYVLTITETWCGDAAQVIPAVSKLIEQNEFLEMRVVLRDENETLMNHFLTNGGKAIPIFIFIAKENLELIGHWGARPDEAQAIVEEYKLMDPKPPYSELSEKLQKWYNEDKGNSTITEFTNRLIALMETFKITNTIGIG